MSTATGSDIYYYEIAGFRFQDGSTLSTTRLAYLDINPSSEKTALIITSFRGRLQSTLTFENGALHKYRIIVVALFGNGESSSPSNSTEFPTSIDYRDCVRAQRLLLEALGIQALDIVMGFSMGGQCAYYWTAMHSDFVRNAIIICASARTSSHNYQFLEGPKAALENSIDYPAYKRHVSGPSTKPIRGLRAFGKAYSAWLTSAEWFDRELYLALGYRSFHDWDHHVAGLNYDSWDPDDLLAKLRMWQGGDITEVEQTTDKQSLEETLSRIKARILLMPCSTDQYFRWEASERESGHIPRATLKVIPSVWGHLAGFGINDEDTRWMDRQITEFLAD
uniref:AB hydrolase-1 domain-containing protein n=1 Tax=Bionectria ochroleuca TaxID=29856 RepID=A0A8H7KA38_BIOOC